MKVEVRTDAELEGLMARLTRPHVQPMLDIMRKVSQSRDVPQSTPFVLAVTGMAFAMAVCHTIHVTEDTPPPDSWEPKPEEVVNMMTSMMMTVLLNCFPDYIEVQTEADDATTH
jgi:hypothetical protein